MDWTGSLNFFFMADDKNYVKFAGSISSNGSGWNQLNAVSDGSVTSSNRQFLSLNRHDLKLSINGYVAKFYDNEDQLLLKVTLQEPLTYTQIKIEGLSHNKLYKLTVKSAEGVTIFPPASGDFEKGKQAGIQQCVAEPTTACGIPVNPARETVIAECQQNPTACGIPVNTNGSTQMGIEQCKANPLSCGITIALLCGYTQEQYDEVKQLCQTCVNEPCGNPSNANTITLTGEGFYKY